MNLPQIGRKVNIQNLLEMDKNIDVPENEKVRQRNPKNLQSKQMTEILGGRMLESSQSTTNVRRPGSRPDTGSKQKILLNNQKQLQINQQFSQPQLGEQNNETNFFNPRSNNLGNKNDQGEAEAQQQISQNETPNQVEARRFSQKQDLLYKNKTFQPSLASYNPNIDRMINMYESQDLEYKEKLNNTERVVTMLIEQLNNVERNQQGELRKYKLQLDNERDYRVKLEANLRFIQDQYNQLNHDLQTRVEVLDTKLQREDRNKNEMREKLILTEQNQKEILFFIRNMQKSETTEILQLRGIMQEKMTEEQSLLQKEREKSKALFMEVVRLGETQERQNDVFNNLQGQFESRIAILEAQLSAGQRSVNQIAQKGDQGINYISDWNEKLERRMQQTEASILSITKEQSKDKDLLSQLEAYHAKMAEDVKVILNTLQSDYDNKLESKVTEIVNRIVMEHEDRIRQHDEMRTNIDMRDRLNQEKSNYEREEMRERYQALDALMRTEFQRKDESIKSLQAIMENQVKGLQNALKFEEQSRNQQEIVFRNEILKMQETFAREYDIFKNQQSNITEKITEMMKIEIQTRLSSDVDLKNLTSAIATDIVSDVNSVKDQMEIQYKKLQDEIRETRLESSQKSEQVSRYVDEEVKKVVEVFSKKHEKTKNMFTKLAEQFKNHLINTDNNRKDVEKRLVGLEKGQEDLRTETYKLVGDTQKAFENRLIEEKLNIELNVQTIAKGLDDKINKVEEESKKDVQFLTQAIENSREMFNNRINNMQNSLEAFQKLCEEQNEQVNIKIQDIKADISDFKEKINTALEELQSNVMKELDDISKDLEELQQNTQKELDLSKSLIINLQDEVQRFSQEIVLKLKEIIDHQQDTEKEFVLRLEELEQSSMNSFNLIKTTLDTIDNVYKDLETKITELNAETVLDNTLAKADMDNIKQQISDMFELMNTQHSDMKLTNTHFEQEFAKISEDIDQVKTNLYYELSEVNDKKLQKLLENIRNENQLLWKKNVELVDSDFKNIDQLRDNKNSLFTQLNEILITQDEYNKPKIKSK
ncbi:hypothetical protein ABPG74_020785 [Tetrahymena malaccensis]